MPLANWKFRVDLNDINRLQDALNHPDCQKLRAWIAHADTYKQEIAIEDNRTTASRQGIHIDFMDNNELWVTVDYTTGTTEAKRIANVLKKIDFVTTTKSP